MESIENNSKEISKYNEANFQIQRLHFKWLEIESFARSGNFREWYYALDGVWRELIADVQRRLSDSKDVIAKHEALRRKKCSTRRQAYLALNERHEFLKVIQDRVGKGGSYQDGATNDFD